MLHHYFVLEVRLGEEINPYINITNIFLRRLQSCWADLLKWNTFSSNFEIRESKNVSNLVTFG